MRDAREGNIEQVVAVQHVVHGLVDVRQAERAVQLPLPDLAIVVVQRLQVLVHLQRLADQPQVECTCIRQLYILLDENTMPLEDAVSGLTT